MNKRVAAVTALAASALLLTACGGNNEEPGTPTPKSTSTSGTASPWTQPAAAKPYTLTTDAHVAPGQEVGGRYQLARLRKTSGADICVDALLGPTPKYANGAGAAGKNTTAYQAASDKAWATLTRGTTGLDLDAAPHELQFRNDLSDGESGAGAVSCQTDLRTDVTVSGKAEEIACYSTVTATTQSAAQLLKADPGFFGRTPDGHETPNVKPTETVTSGPLNFFLVSRCSTEGTPPSAFGPRYPHATSTNTTIGHNLLKAMHPHVSL